MMRFLAERPLVSYLLWGLPLTACMVISLHLARVLGPSGEGPPLPRYVYFDIVPAAAVFAAGLLLTLRRRYCGLGPARLFWLPPIAAVHGVACWNIAYTVALLVQGRSLSGASYIVRDLTREWSNVLHHPNWLPRMITESSLICGAAVLLGILTGLAIAHWKLRTGRRETILPVRGRK